MPENEISLKIRGAIFDVYKKLVGRNNWIPVKTQVLLSFIYDGFSFDIGFRIDLLINKKMVVDLKSAYPFLTSFRKLGRGSCNFYR